MEFSMVRGVLIYLFLTAVFFVAFHTWNDSSRFTKRLIFKTLLKAGIAGFIALVVLIMAVIAF
jgi:hypothetical protein